MQQQFLQTSANYYGAKIYRSSFNLATLSASNDWVKDETNSMIEDILDEIPDEAMMYLINALAFDAEYLTINSEDQIGESTFTPEDGENDAVRMMFSTESKYLDDGKATGFIKDYAGGRYAFVALHLNERTSVSDYLATFTGESLHALLHDVEETPVFTMMPKFESEYKIELSELLEDMGMEDAFDEKLDDLKGLGTSLEGNLYISRVIHKTSISVNERGTKAGAATAVEVALESAALEPKAVRLDRPFLYLIIETESMLPLFMETMMSLN